MLKKHPSMTIGMALLLTLAILGLLAPWIAPYDPLETFPHIAKQPPSWQHLLGTDYAGRDVFSRLLYSIRLSYGGGILAITITAVVGTTLGLLAGYYGSWIDVVIMRIVDLWLAIPGLLFILVMIAILGRGLFAILIAVGLATTPSYARFVRGLTVHEKSQPYIEAAYALGAPPWDILYHHILPNILPSLATLLANYFGGAILAAGSLSFLGLGVKPPTPELGSLLNEGRTVMRVAWWLTMGPLAVLWLTIFAANLISDGLANKR